MVSRLGRICYIPPLTISWNLHHHNLIDEKYDCELIATSPSAQSKPDSSGALSDKIDEIRENKISRYEPLIKPEGGLTYTGFADHDFARQLDILKSLQRLGIVREEPFDFIRKCSKCDHHGMLVKVACPACGSTNTEQGKVIEHLPCGHIDIESKFQQEHDKGPGLVCPKCKKKLKAIGVDYVKPGSFCACLSCKALSPEGRMHFVCLNCGSLLTKEEMKLEPLYAYSVDQEALKKYLDSTGLQLRNSVVELLRRRGVIAEESAAIVGSSQVQHTFDIVGYSGQGESQVPMVAVEIEKSGEPADPESLLNFLARCLDARVARKVFVGVPGFTDEAKKLAGAHGIEIIESAAGEDAAEIADRIAQGIPVHEEVPDEQLEQIIDSMTEAVAEEEGEPRLPEEGHKPAEPPQAEDRASLEKMLKMIIRPANDDDRSRNQEGT
jgi:hypothetical protein